MRNSFGSSILLIILLGTISSSTFVNDDCEELKKENEKLKTELQDLQKMTEEQRRIAEEAISRATASEIEARRQQKLVDATALEARRQQKLAEATALEARRQQKRAEEAELKLKNATEEAIKSRDRAQQLYVDILKKNQAQIDSIKRVNGNK
jgi:Na+-transporting NADH:ubiquinone oxidoreductase subunit NqrC